MSEQMSDGKIGRPPHAKITFAAYRYRTSTRGTAGILDGANAIVTRPRSFDEGIMVKGAGDRQPAMFRRASIGLARTALASGCILGLGTEIRVQVPRSAPGIRFARVGLGRRPVRLNRGAVLAARRPVGCEMLALATAPGRAADFPPGVFMPVAADASLLTGRAAVRGQTDAEMDVGPAARQAW